MATMIPDSVEQFTTEGERQTYRFLEAVAKPDNRFVCWYLPDIQGKEPDFILYSQKNGLIVLEVKDWNLDQIREVNPQHLILDVDGKSRQNPIKQARDYVSAMMDTVKADGRLISKDPVHHGNSKIPMTCGVVFPNINKYEYVRKGFDQVIETGRIFFWDDLHPASDICADPTGACFSKVLDERFPPRFAFTLTGPEMDHLKQLIFPVVRVEIPKRQCDFPYEKRICRFKGLDHHQEALARKFEIGHRIITGPSGSGKTLILVNKAACLLRYNPSIKSILFICYNITLVNYIRRLLSEKRVPFGRDGVEVKHFYELCSDILGEQINYESEESDYYDMVAQEALEKACDSGVRYDAVLVDEGQDFSDTMFKVVISLVNRVTDNLTIALDDNQAIYHHRSPWKDLGVKARGRVHRIDYMYRNTVEITNFATKFIGCQVVEDSADSGQMDLFPDYFDFRGPHPELKRLDDLNAIHGYVAEKIDHVVRSDGCPYSEIALLYTKKRLESPDTLLPEQLSLALAAKGIISRWAAENFRSKRTYDISTNSVTISTIHSAKGLDFSCVLLIGLDYLEPKGWTEEQIQNLVYVGITRARYQLFIPYVHKTPLIQNLEACR